MCQAERSEASAPGVVVSRTLPAARTSTIAAVLVRPWAEAAARPNFPECLRARLRQMEA